MHGGADPAVTPWVRNCGVRVLAVGPERAVSLVLEAALRADRDPEARPGVVAHLCNAWTLACARSDPAYAAVLERGDLPFADGTPLVWFARLAGSDVRRRVYGPDLVLDVADAGRMLRVRHYLLGGTPETVVALRAALDRHAPGLEVVGFESPPFGPLSDADLSDIAERIVSSGATVVWVGLGTPQQDIVVDRLRNSVPAVLVPVGAAFDFISGNRRQAPRWVQRCGLEWLFRLSVEPRRLWRRYVLGIPNYVAGSLIDLVAARGRPHLHDGGVPQELLD
ncbi:MAG: WecB/TagA/CpsF family glycosyltransferase [Actinobacteria bacterium]|nr:WecB/TagA/CpsF family glycosyltransferase [Actinomycetota bacterium]